MDQVILKLLWFVYEHIGGTYSLFYYYYLRRPEQLWLCCNLFSFFMFIIFFEIYLDLPYHKVTTNVFKYLTFYHVSMFFNALIIKSLFQISF